MQVFFYINKIVSIYKKKPRFLAVGTEASNRQYFYANISLAVSIYYTGGCHKSVTAK